MQANFYVISLPPGRLVATEIDSAEAAVALDAGETLLLARPLELVRVALLHDRLLTICLRDRGAATPSGRGHGAVADSHPEDDARLVLVGSRYQGFRHDGTLSAPLSRDDRPALSQPRLVAAVGHN